MRTLDELRQELNKVDEQILKLLEQRFRITDEVAVVKNASGAPLTDKTREEELLSRLKQSASHPALREYIEDIYTQIMSLNKKARVFNEHDTLTFRSIGIIGLGMIGGSIAKALQSRYHKVIVSTIQRDSDDNRYGTHHGYIDHEYASIDEMVLNTDLIILATPIETIASYAVQIAASAQQRNADSPLIVIDVASTKQTIAEDFQTHASDKVQFVPTHPMAGSEKMGFANAKAMLFVQKPWVITPHSTCSPHAIELVRDFIRYLGSRVEESTPEEHDMLVASVSHLVFLLSTYLFAFCNEHTHEALRMAGSGFETTTRLASGNAGMHSQIYLNNEANIQKTVQKFISFIQNQAIDSSSCLTFFEQNKKERDMIMSEREE